MKNKPPAHDFRQVVHELQERIEERAKAEVQLRARCKMLESENEVLRQQIEEARDYFQRVQTKLRRAQDIIDAHNELLAREKAAASSQLETMDDEAIGDHNPSRCEPEDTTKE